VSAAGKKARAIFKRTWKLYNAAASAAQRLQAPELDPKGVMERNCAAACTSNTVAAIEAFQPFQHFDLMD